MKKLIFLLLIGLAVIGTVFAAGTVYCKMDNFVMFVTGRMKSEVGGTFWEYKCSNGHTQWEKQ